MANFYGRNPWQNPYFPGFDDGTYKPPTGYGSSPYTPNAPVQAPGSSFDMSRAQDVVNAGMRALGGRGGRPNNFLGIGAGSGGRPRSQSTSISDFFGFGSTPPKNTAPLGSKGTGVGAAAKATEDPNKVKLNAEGHGDYGPGRDSLGNYTHGDTMGTGVPMRVLKQQWQIDKMRGDVDWTGSFTNWVKNGMPKAGQYTPDQMAQIVSGAKDPADFNYGQPGGAAPGAAPAPGTPPAAGTNPPNWFVPGIGNGPWNPQNPAAQYPAAPQQGGGLNINPETGRPVAPGDAWSPYPGGSMTQVTPNPGMSDRELQMRGYIRGQDGSIAPMGGFGPSNVWGPNGEYATMDRRPIGQGGQPYNPDWQNMKRMFDASYGPGNYDEQAVMQGNPQEMIKHLQDRSAAGYGPQYMDGPGAGFNGVPNNPLNQGAPGWIQPSYGEATNPGMNDEQYQRFLQAVSGVYMPYMNYMQGAYQFDRGQSELERNNDWSRRFQQGTWGAEFNEGNRRYGQDFGESARRYNQDFGEAKRRFDEDMAWQKRVGAFNATGRGMLPNARFVSFG